MAYDCYYHGYGVITDHNGRCTQCVREGTGPDGYETKKQRETLRAAFLKCDPTLESSQSPVPHKYKETGKHDYGSLAQGGSYEQVKCTECGRTAWSMMPD